MKTKLLWIIIFLVSFSACKKDDAIPPDVTINSPQAMESFDVQEQFSVQVEVSDNMALEAVYLTITDENQNNVTETWSLPVTTNPVILNKYISADDIHLPTGKYYIHASAFDGTNTGSDFVEINLQAVPLALKNVYLVSSSTGVSYIYSVDGSSTVYQSSFSGNYSDGLASSYNQYFTIGANGNGGVYGFDPEFNEELWKINELQTLYPYAIKCFEDEISHRVYWSHGSGEIKAYDENGSVRNSFVIQTGNYPEDLIVNDDYVVVEEVISSSYSLNVYNKGAGSFVQSYALPGNIVGMASKNSDEIYLLIEESGQTAIYVYSINSNSAWQPIGTQTGVPYDLAQVDEGQLIIATSTDLFLYTYQTSNMISLSNGNYSVVEYDELNDLILTANGSQLIYFDRQGNAQATVNHSSNIDDIWLYYNK